LGNIAYRLGREVNFDATQADFGADTIANRMLTTTSMASTLG
jgi:hypothetical protein